MRWRFKLMIAVLLGLVGLQLALGQLPFPFGGLGGPRSKDGRADPLTLLRNASVKKELRLSDDQAAKVDDVVWEALGKVLDPDQLKRLKQIDMQQRDYLAFGDPSLQTTLKLTSDQKDSIKTILTDADKELASLMEGLKGAFGGGFAKGGIQGIQGIPEKAAAIRKETRERCAEVLTGDQRRMWEELVGEEFKIDLPKLDLGDFFKKKKGG